MTHSLNDEEHAGAEQREYYKLYRDRIKSEDTLVSNRLTWLLLPQAVLFGICATSVFSKEGFSVFGLALVTTLGIGVCVLGNFSIGAALTTIEQMRQLYADNFRHCDPKLPPLTADEGMNNRGKWAARYLPWCFIICWLLLFLYGILAKLFKLT